VDRRLGEALGRVPLLSALNQEQLDRLAASAVVEDYPRDLELFSVGETAHSFLLVLSGAVKVYALSPDGREHILHLVSEGGLVGEGAVFGQGTYPASAMTVRESTVARFDRRRLVEALRDDPELALAMIAGLSQRLRQFVQVIEDLSLRDVTARLARFILQNSSDGECRLPGTKTQLAAQLGTVLEPLSRALRRLREAGLIQERGGVLILLDGEGLQEIVEGLREV